MEIRADQLVVRTDQCWVSIGDACGAVIRVVVPGVDEPAQDVAAARQRLLELADAATAAAGELA